MEHKIEMIDNTNLEKISHDYIQSILELHLPKLLLKHII